MTELALKNCRLDRRYDIFSHLGRGSYAEIFVARDTLAPEMSPHRQVVIKALNVFLSDDLDPELERTLVENFQNEAIALDRVRHPNVINRLGHGTARDARSVLFHYLVLEYLEGGDLQKVCRGGNCSLHDAFRWIEQTCAGLRHAHQNGVIHRDIKPQNLLLTRDHETVKIADFGVARLATSDSPITRVGTNIYAAPEHSPWRSDGDVMTVPALTPAADIYSLAKTIYTLVTGEAPRAYVNGQVTELPQSFRSNEAAPELLRVIRRATSRSPEERHQSVDEFWSDLSEVRRIAGTLTPSYPGAAIPAAQPHVARGYSPLAPSEPQFNTSRELKMRHRFGPAIEQPQIDLAEVRTPRQPAIAPPMPVIPALQPDIGEMERERFERSRMNIEIPNAIGAARAGKIKKPNKLLRRFAMIGVLVLALIGGLYATHTYLPGLVSLPQVLPWTPQTGTANTDIYLRPAPNPNNDPIGLVTKNSRIRIVKTQNNWYQVDVIEQGRQRADAPPGTRGWLNGKYIDLDQRP